MKIRPLPSHVASLLQQYSAAPRLLAHLLLVHEVACVLTEQMQVRWPRLAYDVEAVRLGAATHDIGKVEHPDELSAPGHAHEQAGYHQNGTQLRLDETVSPGTLSYTISK